MNLNFRLYSGEEFQTLVLSHEPQSLMATIRVDLRRELAERLLSEAQAAVVARWLDWEPQPANKTPVLPPQHHASIGRTRISFPDRPNIRELSPRRSTVSENTRNAARPQSCVDESSVGRRRMKLHPRSARSP